MLLAGPWSGDVVGVLVGGMWSTRPDLTCCESRCCAWLAAMGPLTDAEVCWSNLVWFQYWSGLRCWSGLGWARELGSTVWCCGAMAWGVCLVMFAQGQALERTSWHQCQYLTSTAAWLSLLPPEEIKTSTAENIKRTASAAAAPLAGVWLSCSATKYPTDDS